MGGSAYGKPLRQRNEDPRVAWPKDSKSIRSNSIRRCGREDAWMGRPIWVKDAWMGGRRGCSCGSKDSWMGCVGLENTFVECWIELERWRSTEDPSMECRSTNACVAELCANAEPVPRTRTSRTSQLGRIRLRIACLGCFVG